jgi:hypothetical protein
MLGDKPETFARMPILSEAKGEPTSFFVLTRETFAAAPKAARRAAGPSGREATAGSGGSSGAVAVPRRVESWWLYSLRRTTPEAMFERKVGLKEYGDALTWARHYGFSADPVRQAQWRDAPVSSVTVSDFLARVSSCRWVLAECTSRLADEPGAMLALLQHGIRRCHDAPLGEERGQGEEGVARAGTDARPVAGDENELSRSEVKQFRRRLLRYRKRLRVWVAMAEAEAEALGQPEPPPFDPQAHAQFREAPLAVAAAQLAQAQRFAALAVLLRAHAHATANGARAEAGAQPGGASVGCGWVLRALAEVPEVTPPAEYEPLLRPALHDLMRGWAAGGGEGGSDSGEHSQGLEDLVFSPSVERLLDASEAEAAEEEEAEEEEFGLAGHAGTGDGAESRGWAEGGGREAACAWLCDRARQIDARTGLLDFALEIAEIGASCVRVTAAPVGHDDSTDPPGSPRVQGGSSSAAELSRLLGRLRQLYPLAYELGAPTPLAVFETLNAPGRLALLLDLGAAEASEAVRAPRGGRISAAEALQAYGIFLRRRVWPFVRHERQPATLLRDEALRRLADVPDGNSNSGAAATHAKAAARGAAPPEPPHALLHAASIVHCSRLSLPRSDRMLKPVNLMLRAAVDVAYACAEVDDEALQMLTAMYAGLPRAQEAEAEEAAEGCAGAGEEEAEGCAGGEAGAGGEGEAAGVSCVSLLSALLTEVDQLGSHLRAQRILTSYGLSVSMSAFREATGKEGAQGLSGNRAQQILQQMARSVARGSRGGGGDVWHAARDDMLALCALACPATSAQLPLTEWLHALLLSGRFSLAADALREAAQRASVSPNRVLPRISPRASRPSASSSLPSPRALPEFPALDSAAAESVVLSASREFFNGAADASDPALCAASRCIRVLPPPLSPEASRELALVDAAQLASELGSTLVPLQLRLHLATDARALLLSLAASVPVSALPRLEALAAALAMAGGGHQAAEMDALHAAVAERAMCDADTRTALRLATGLVERNYGPAWTVCDRLCDEDETTNRQWMEALELDLAHARPALLAHVLAHCPPDRFGSRMERWRRAAGRSHGTAQPPAVSASRDPALALALSCDRPSVEKLGMLRSQLSASLLAAADAAAPTAIRRVCRLGKRAYAVALAAVAREPPAVIRRVAVTPAAQLSRMVDRCVAAVPAGEATALRAWDGCDTCARPEATNTVSACIAAREHFYALEGIEARLSEAEAILPHLPDVNMAAYATDEFVRRDVIRRLARCASGAAFELAQQLACAAQGAGGAQLLGGSGPAARAVTASAGGGANTRAIAAVGGLRLAAETAGPHGAGGEAVWRDGGGGAVVGAHGKAQPRGSAGAMVAEAEAARREEAEAGRAGAGHASDALDAWELRMERTDAILWETVRAAEAESSPPAVLSPDAATRTAGLVMRLRSAVAEHAEALLAEPSRLIMQLATVTLRQSGETPHPAVFLCANRPATCRAPTSTPRALACAIHSIPYT